MDISMRCYNIYFFINLFASDGEQVSFYTKAIALFTIANSDLAVSTADW